MALTKAGKKVLKRAAKLLIVARVLRKKAAKMKIKTKIKKAISKRRRK